jgi:ADP-heptose:LPS heptosyltransferase
MKTRLDDSGIVIKDTRLQAFSVSRANENPPKRIVQIQKLIHTKRPSIAVLRGEGIGDVIMTTPTINALYNYFGGNVDITYATNTQYLNGALVKVLQGNPQISKIIDRQNLKEEDFDAVVNLHCPAIAHEKPMAAPINRIDLFARHAGFFPLKDTKVKLYITEEEKEKARDYLYSLGLNGALNPIIMVNLFSSSNTRSLNRQVILDTVQQLSNKNWRILLVQHNSDHEHSRYFQEIPHVYPIVDKDIRELSAILTHINLLLCPDSALLHAAGALDIPTVAIFAPTDPRARINYYPKAKAVWGGQGLNGHPHWYEACPFHDICWKNITTEGIMQIIQEVQNEMTKPNNIEAMIL